MPAKKPSNPKRLHRSAIHHNWDDGTFKLDRILFDKACDHGTALAIYWMSGAGYYRQYKTLADAEAYERPMMRFLRALEKRLVARDFKTSDILFNPRFDCTTCDPTGHDWTTEYDDLPVKRPIPPALYEPSAPDPAWEKIRTKPRKKQRSLRLR